MKKKMCIPLTHNPNSRFANLKGNKHHLITAPRVACMLLYLPPIDFFAPQGPGQRDEIFEREAEMGSIVQPT